MTRTLREADKLEMLRLGLDVDKALFKTYRQAFYRKTVFIDGKIAAMFGVVGTPLGINGQPYLLTGTAIETVSPIVFIRTYITELEKIKRFFPVLENIVDARYYGAIRALKIAGFKIKKPIEINGHLFRTFSLGV